MPCNGWNHPASCNCGWGGMNHGGPRRSASLFSKLESEPPELLYQQIWESFLNPNARCPVCGDRVYFYQSEYGGRVFFDSLAPDWTKHPCTDRRDWSWEHFDPKAPPPPPKFAPSDEPKPLGPPPGSGSASLNVGWLEEGWMPIAQVASAKGRGNVHMFKSLSGATISFAGTGEQIEILWPTILSFDWSGPVFGRRHAKYKDIIEFQSVDFAMKKPQATFFYASSQLSADTEWILMRLRLVRDLEEDMRKKRRK